MQKTSVTVYQYTPLKITQKSLNAPQKYFVTYSKWINIYLNSFNLLSDTGRPTLLHLGACPISLLLIGYHYYVILPRNFTKYSLWQKIFRLIVLVDVVFQTMHVAVASCLIARLLSLGKTAESPTTILIQDWFKNYKLKWGFGSLPPIIMLIYINLVEYNMWCIPKHSRMLQM